MPVSERTASVRTPIIPVVGELIRLRPGTISLGQGAVHYAPPPEALRRLSEAVASPGAYVYGEVRGRRVLIDRLERKLADENGIDVEQGLGVVVTAGANMAFLSAVLAIADPGDEIILPTPFYFNHEMAVGLAGCRAVPVSTDAAWHVQLSALEEAITERTRAVVTVSPNNPTGSVYGEATLRAIGRLCRERGLYHVSDEAYEHFVYGGARHFSPGSAEGAGRHTISLYSFSKSFGLSGLRVGYMVVPHHLLGALDKIQDTMLVCPPIPNQCAALGALEAGAAYTRPFVAGLAKVRAQVRERLSELGDGVTIPSMEGAFYALIRVRTEREDMEVVRHLIEEHGVAVLPGRAFGIEQGCCLRIAYGALPGNAVAEAMDRLVGGLKQWIA